MIKYNNEFKTIDTEEKAYLLGLLYADGSLRSEHNQNTMRLSLIDEELILHLHEIFPFFKFGSFDYSKYNRNNQIQYFLTCSDVNFKKDLISIGMIPQKATTACSDLLLPNLSDELMRHFIRGFFDGDGTICNSKNRPTNYIVAISGVAHSFIKDMGLYLNKVGLDFKYYYRKPYQQNRKDVSIIKLYKSKNLLDFKQYLYNEATIFLNRKHDKFSCIEDIKARNRYSLNIIKNNKKQNLFCPHCESYHVTKSGYCNYSNVQRLKCQNCNKKFNISKTTLNPVNSGEVQ